KENYFEVPPVEYWDFIADQTGASDAWPASQGVTFKPVIDPLGRQVTAIEAIATLNGDTALEGLPKYQASLNAARQAFNQAGRACPEGMPLYVSLLPMTLVAIPEAVRMIVDEIRVAGLVPEQVIIGVSETEVISQLDAFSVAVRQLKEAGISLSIDNFGDGSAGLSMLTRIQPDRIRIGAGIIRDVHRSGPKQAVVQAIIKCCSALEITVIAAGIERPEEWMWLEAAGVINFQGRLFSDTGAAVAWPELREAI
ncbi:EAL domain-containing protein, partial [Pantoea septica]